MDFITIKPKASQQVKNLISELPSDVGLRLAVKGGGCSGLSDGFKIFMDAKSMIYLKGMAVDFDDSLQGKGFIFINPNATNTCGCGESFSMS